jgi:hypothetical protein
MHDEERRQVIQEEEALADESDDDLPIRVICSKMLCTDKLYQGRAESPTGDGW